MSLVEEAASLCAIALHGDCSLALSDFACQWLGSLILKDELPEVCHSTPSFSRPFLRRHPHVCSYSLRFMFIFLFTHVHSWFFVQNGSFLLLYTPLTPFIFGSLCRKVETKTCPRDLRPVTCLGSVTSALQYMSDLDLISSEKSAQWTSLRLMTQR